ncbi:MAG: nuclear transport factor 2 family protein [Solirubrobacteraceae bacterium]
MTRETLSEFDRQYLETWTEPDPQRRRANIERLWSADGRMVISSIGLTVSGIDEIAAHVARVHEQNIVERGLRFVYDQHAEAEDALLLRWSMLAPDDGIAGRGVDVLFRNADGLVQTVYMFMGID